MKPKHPVLEIGPYSEHGFDILELIHPAPNIQLRRYRVFWHCCRTEGEACQRALINRMKNPEIILCVTCSRKNNGASIFQRDTPPPELDLFIPNAPSKPTFSGGIISAARAWPVPKLLRASQ